MGVDLLRKVCSKRALINFLSRKNSPNNFEKLIYELTKHKGTFSNETVESSRAKESDSSKQEKTHHEPGKCNEGNHLPIEKSINQGVHNLFRSNSRSNGANRILLPNEPLTKLEDQKKDLYAERDHLHPQLMLVDSDEKRYELAKRIQDISPKISKLNQVIYQIKETGQIPMKMAVELLSAKEWKRLENIKVNIRRLKRELKNPKSISDKENNEKRLKEYQAAQTKLLTYA
jgi:hypothetical protein